MDEWLHQDRQVLLWHRHENGCLCSWFAADDNMQDQVSLFINIAYSLSTGTPLLSQDQTMKAFHKGLAPGQNELQHRDHQARFSKCTRWSTVQTAILIAHFKQARAQQAARVQTDRSAINMQFPNKHLLFSVMIDRHHMRTVKPGKILWAEQADLPAVAEWDTE